MRTDGFSRVRVVVESHGEKRSCLRPEAARRQPVSRQAEQETRGKAHSHPKRQLWSEDQASVLVPGPSFDDVVFTHEGEVCDAGIIEVRPQLKMTREQHDDDDTNPHAYPVAQYPSEQLGERFCLGSLQPK